MLHTYWTHFMSSFIILSHSLSAILRLPSILLYDHSLLTRATDSSPHPKAPYPVMFVCSSMDKTQTSMSTFDVDEARLVVETANHYLSQWPDCWSKFQVDQACILARTHKQVINCCFMYRLAPRFSSNWNLHTLENCMPEVLHNHWV